MSIVKRSLLIAALCLSGACGSTPIDHRVPVQPPATADEVRQSAIVPHGNPPLTLAQENADAWQYVWQTKLGMTTTLGAFPAVTFHNQTSNDALICPTASGMPKKGRVTNNGNGGNCDTGWLPPGNTSVGIVTFNGAAPYQTDVARWICKLANVYGHPQVCNTAWSETTRKELWLRYHGPAAYRFGPDHAWHDFFGVDASVPISIDFVDDCPNAFPSSCGIYGSTYAPSGPYYQKISIPLNTLYTSGDANTHLTQTRMGAAICYMAFNRAYADGGAQASANCNAGPGDVTHALNAYLDSLFYP